jgi:DNA-binding NtrC family response regulator
MMSASPAARPRSSTSSWSGPGIAMNENIVRDERTTDARTIAMVGDSEVFREACGLLRRYAACHAPVLIEGETGTGKELAAREIHYVSPRADGPFVPVNCGALPDALLESELFGHRRGAFTDARSSEPGLVEYAQGGSLFLDEIDSLSLRAQTILLRFLQNGEFRAVGERALRSANVRVIAATNVSLASAVEEGRFRRDLFYRLNPLYVKLPALRRRGRDAVLLARHLLGELVDRMGIAPRTWRDDALEALLHHDWPGNVRELENLILRLCMRSDRSRLDLSDLSDAEPAIWGELAMGEASHDTDDHPHDDDDATHDGSEYATAKRMAIRHFERDYLTALMRRSGGNISRAAVLSGTERRHLGKMLKRHGIDRHVCDSA